MADKPMVRMCSWCQQINGKNMAAQAATIPAKIKEEMKVVDEQVRANKDNFTFTHGVCIPHVIQTYSTIPNMTEEKLKSIVDKVQKSDPPPCLVEDTPEMAALRHAYMRGLFTKESMQQAIQTQQSGSAQLTERLQVLAGIRNLHA